MFLLFQKIHLKVIICLLRTFLFNSLFSRWHSLFAIFFINCWFKIFLFLLFLAKNPWSWNLLTCINLNVLVRSLNFYILNTLKFNRFIYFGVCNKNYKKFYEVPFLFKCLSIRLLVRLFYPSVSMLTVFFLKIRTLKNIFFGPLYFIYKIPFCFSFKIEQLAIFVK